MRSKYKEALVLSRNFGNRSVEETRRLYKIIQQAVSVAQRRKGTDTPSKDAIAFLVKVYEPYVKKVAGKYYPFVEKRMEFNDVLQETYLMFLTLLYRYDKNIASFSYFMKLLLPQHMYVWVEKVMSDNFLPVDIKVIETSLSHPDLDETNKVYDYYDSKILENEYINYILERSEKSSRSSTVKEVCLKVFLGSTTCSALSKELGITYHAVYEIINKIKKELKYFFHENMFSEYVLSSTGRVVSYNYGRK